MGTVFPTARARLFTAVSGVALLAVLAGCDGSDKKQSSTDHYTKAVEYRTKGDTAAALIEVKNALQADAKNGPAHLLRGQILMDAGDIWGAEDELRAASTAGVPASDWFAPLGQSLLMQQKLPKLRDLVAQVPAQDSALQARGKAFLGEMALSSRDAAGARKSFGDALALNERDTAALLGMVHVELAAGAPDKAAGWLAKAQAVAPTDAEVYSAEAAVDSARRDPVAMEAALRKVTAAKPNNPFYRLTLAQALVGSKKDEEADKLLVSILKQMPDYPMANHLRAIILYRAGKYKEADDIETNVLSKAPNLKAAQFLDGLAKYPLGQYAQTEHLLNGLDLGGSDGDEAKLIRAAALMQLGRQQEAYRLVQPLESSMANNPIYLKVAAAAAQANNDLPKSRDLYQRALAVDPKNADLLTHLATVKLDLGDTAGGTANLDKAIEAAPNDDQALGTLFASLLKNKQYDKALELAQRAQTAHPDKPQGWVMAGMVQAFQNKMDDAVTAFAKALQIDPAASDAINDLAGVYLAQGRIDLARSTIEDGYKRAPKQASICATGAKIESAAKNPAGVQTWLERQLDIDPKAPEPRADLIQVLILTNQPQKAVSVGLTGLQLTPGNPITLKALGQAYLAANTPDKAAANLRDLVAAQPEADNYFLLARAYIDLHDEQRLRDTVEQLVQKAPDFRPGRLLLARLLLDQKETLPRADTMIAALAKETPDDADVIELQARVAGLKSGPKAAIAFLQKALADQKTPARTLVFLLASSQWDDGQQAASMKTTADWAAAHPDDTSARMSLANRQIQIKQYADAHKTLDEEIRINPNNWVAQNNLAWVLMTQGDLKGAQEQIDSAHKLAGPQQDILDTEGQIALARGDAPHAVDLLKLATLTGTPAPSTQIHLAKALIATGKPKEAQDALKSAIAAARTGTDADDAKALLATIKN